MPENQAPFVMPRRADTIEILARQIDASARDLAVRIEAGMFSELDDDTRCDLRGLSLAMSGWAEGMREAEQERAGEVHVARAARLFGRFHAPH